MRKGLLGFVIAFAFGCSQWWGQDVEYGLNPDFNAYVPARIAVLHCSLMPQTFVAKAMGPSNLTPESQKRLLNSCDEFVRAGFADQPYMRGFTPRVVEQLIEKSPSPTLMDSMYVSWKLPKHEANHCDDFLSLYRAHFKDVPEWKVWLKDFSLATRYSDSLLIPLFTQANEVQIDNRGMYISELRATLDLLLIDTGSAEVIWSARRKETVAATRYPDEQHQGFLPYPDWKIMFERLFIDAIWRGFPGRIEH